MFDNDLLRGTGVAGFALIVLIAGVAYKLRATHGVPQDLQKVPLRKYARQIKDIIIIFPIYVYLSLISLTYRG